MATSSPCVRSASVPPDETEFSGACHRGRVLARRVSWRIPPGEIDAQFAAAGLSVRAKRFFAPGFSEKVLVLAEKRIR